MAEKVMVFNILKSLKNHMKLIGGIALLSMLTIWALLAYILAPNYEATSQILMEQPEVNMPSAGQMENLVDPQVLDAFSAIIKSREVLSAAIAANGSSMNPTELYDRVTVSNVDGSQVLNITVEGKDRVLAAELANSLADFAIIETRARLKVNNLSIIAKASIEEVPSVLEEKAFYVLAIGGLFGIIVGVLLAFISELFNMLFRTGILERRRKQSKLQTVFK